MEKLLRPFEKKSWIIALISTSLAAFAILFGAFGGFAGGTFISVLASVILIALEICAFGLVIVTIAMKQKAVVAKYSAALLTGICVYFFMNALGSVRVFGSFNNGLAITFAILLLLEVIAFIVSLAFYGLAVFGGKRNLIPLAKSIALCACGFAFIPLILGIVLYAQQGAGWTSYFTLFGDVLLLPMSLTFTLLYAFSSDEAIAEEAAEEAPAEEAPVEETPAEEAPAEEEAPEKDAVPDVEEVPAEENPEEPVPGEVVE